MLLNEMGSLLLSIRFQKKKKKEKKDNGNLMQSFIYRKGTTSFSKTSVVVIMVHNYIITPIICPSEDTRELGPGSLFRHRPGPPSTSRTQLLERSWT